MYDLLLSLWIGEHSPKTRVGVGAPFHMREGSIIFAQGLLRWLLFFFGRWRKTRAQGCDAAQVLWC